jgi:hypothetical protein
MSNKRFWQKQPATPAPAPRPAPTLRGSKSYSLAEAEAMGCFDEDALNASDARQARDPEEMGHV